MKWGGKCVTENTSDSETNKTGNIIVNSIPDGVSVKLDGKDTGKKTPATLENITPGGLHKVEANLPDCRQISRNVSVSAGNTSTICLKKYTEEEVNKIRNIGIYIALIPIILIAIILYLIYGSFDDLAQIIPYIACSGGLGACAYSIFGYTYHLGKDDFDLNFCCWFMLRPILGIIFGIFSFLFVAGGLMTLSGVPASTELFTPPQTVMFYCALAFLAGYSEHSFSAQLKELGEALFKKADTSKEIIMK